MDRLSSTILNKPSQLYLTFPSSPQATKLQRLQLKNTNTPPTHNYRPLIGAHPTSNWRSPRHTSKPPGHTQWTLTYELWWLTTLALRNFNLTTSRPMAELQIKNNWDYINSISFIFIISLYLKKNNKKFETSILFLPALFLGVSRPNH